MFKNKYAEIVGFFLGDFQYLENDQVFVLFLKKKMRNLFSFCLMS